MTSLREILWRVCNKEMHMNYKVLIAVIALAGEMVAGAETTYFRDLSGRIIGTRTVR